MSVRIWVIQPGRPWVAVETFQAVLKTTASGATWAIVASLNDRRFKVGSTAFLTPEAADRRRLGKAAAILQPKNARYLNLYHPSIVDAAASVRPPRVFRGQLAT